MPNVLLDNDSKYINLVETYKNILEDKYKNKIKDEIFLSKESSCRIFDNILEALNWITNNKDDMLKNKLINLTGVSLEEKFNRSNSKSTKINVVITGSLYLVGLSLKVLNYKID
jgi:hypothetical protein